MDSSIPPAKFPRSFALLDGDGRLIDWDDGFALEWSEAAALIRPGATYAELFNEVVRHEPGHRLIDADLPAEAVSDFLRRRVEDFGTDRTLDYRTAAGRIIHVAETRTASGGILRVARDVTAEREAARALAEARQQIEAAGPDVAGIFVEFKRRPDASYEFAPISADMQALLGLPLEFVGHEAPSVHVLMNDTTGDKARWATIEQAARTLEMCLLEFSVPSADGKTRHFRQSMMPRRELDGTVIFSGVIRDVTRERRAEDHIELLQSIVIRSSDAIIAFETRGDGPHDTEILYVNPKFEELFGGSAGALVGRRSTVLRPDALSRASSAVLTQALARGDGEPVEFQAHGKDGGVLWIEARTEMVQRSDDGSYRWVVISRDITERRAAQEELLRAKNAAEAGNRAKSNFLATMSHELRTPLNAIIGFTELLEQGVARTGWIETYREYLADIGESGRHLLGLINTVLDLSKIEAGSLTLDIDRVDIAEMVQGAVVVLSGMAKDSEVEIISEPIPDVTIVAGDFLKLKQVVLNVLSNAIKFTPPGGKIGISTAATGDTIIIIIADTGCGIAPADLERVTIPFVQVESSLSRRYPGTGLGLPIAVQLCRLHGGKLDITSVEGAGTTVYIHLPVKGP